MTSRLIKPEEDHLLPAEYKYGLVRSVSHTILVPSNHILDYALQGYNVC